ncbi:MAG: tetratricopeptide repeat protein [Planctomycetota bacterium JB042]
MTHSTDPYHLGFLAFKEERFEDAIESLERFLEREPEHVEALHTIGMAHYRREEWADALRYGERLVDVAPTDPLSFTTLSLFLMKNGRIEEAEEAGAKAKVLKWKRELKEGPGGSAGLDVLDAAPPSSPPVMPTMPQMPTLPEKPRPPEDADPDGDG